ncbi:cobyrinate a,c-diamide synthase [Sinanaerobacter chloroacetimidivorans]|jgi:cobyrinic acid a,c-diamide synthase|uniref:Cobyrinate a,c-diamide synthase n=1 Tax=Sinanaerobacter chloroacetimidivorans TaxID=2818044 RepID=A0A8J7W191_9FIRM|nr:cobyrinate a,c-diamide synthase [Sinanaerobacter chloroacetimidivorans]MBR0597345.1 cobyrinate a,c-diamide synthase [Sinanaerobacter chloroacetimidivorans]
MEQRSIPRIMIAATGSGSGKTTVTCGLLQAFLNRGKKLASFKSGPDYIDPMFHAEVLGVKSRNLDLFFTGENLTKYLFCKNSENTDLAVMEGVMGFYDGLAGKSMEGSSYDLARKTQTPVILVMDCKGMSVSIVAAMKGFLELRPDHFIKGVILNRISPMIYEDIREFIESELNVSVLGYLPIMEACRLESRHLGLVTAKEIGNLKGIVQQMAAQMEATIDLEKILEISKEALPVTYEIPEEVKRIKKFIMNVPVKIAVALDKAFCFYYQDNLDLLQELGVQIVPFSPLEDEFLPEGIDGLILGGGYPELYLEQLSRNKNLLCEIRRLVRDGLPCLAECGGFMYLHQYVLDRDGIPFEMAGVIEGESFPTIKLARFGYLTLTALEDNLLCNKGAEIKGHEFHYWDSTNPGKSFHAQKPLRKVNWDCIITQGNLWAGYPHIHFYSNIEVAFEFLRKVVKG